MAVRSLGARLLRLAAALAIVGMLASVVIVAALGIERRSELILPAPTGPFAVGRTSFDWVDNSHVDSVAPVPGTKREVLVWLWYPADDARTPAAEYSPLEMRAAATRVLGPPSGIINFLTRDPDKVRAHSLGNAALSTREHSYPVVILRGGASVGVTNYTTIAEDLASHGFVVAGIDAPYRTGVVVFPDGRVVQRTRDNNPEILLERKQTDRLNEVFAEWVAGVGFVVDRLKQLNDDDTSGRFTGRLDLQRLGVFGHSWGGAQAMQFCADDSRCKAVVDIDGAPFGPVIQTGIAKPLMFLLSDLGDFSSDAEVRQIRADIQAIYGRLPEADRLRVAIAGANHFTFTDDGALLKSAVFRGVLRAFGRLRIGGRRQLEVTAYAVRTFFDARLKDGPPVVTVVSPLFPEIRQID